MSQFTTYLTETSWNWFALYTLPSKKSITSCQVDSSRLGLHTKKREYISGSIRLGLQLQAYTWKTGSPRDVQGLNFGRKAVIYACISVKKSPEQWTWMKNCLSPVYIIRSKSYRNKQSVSLLGSLVIEPQ